MNYHKLSKAHQPTDDSLRCLTGKLVTLERKLWRGLGVGGHLRGELSDGFVLFLDDPVESIQLFLL